MHYHVHLDLLLLYSKYTYFVFFNSEKNNLIKIFTLIKADKYIFSTFFGNVACVAIEKHFVRNCCVYCRTIGVLCASTVTATSDSCSRLV
jgi:hypothetical protein